MKTAGLLVYLLITGFITLYVGKVLFKNGRHFLLSMLADAEVTDAVNKILLVGYYLINLGYVSIMLTFQPPITNFGDLVSSLSTSVGRIMLTLGIMHYFNIAIVTIWNKITINPK
jgi:hypothetical protein